MRARLLAFVEDGAVRGYGVMRACRSGFKIGPLFADGEARGRSYCFVRWPRKPRGRPRGRRSFSTCRSRTGAAVRLATRHGLSPVFETARMYRGEAPGLPLSLIYGISTFELG